MKCNCLIVNKTIIMVLLLMIASFNAYANKTGTLTAHSNLFVTPTHGGLAWTSDKLLGRNVLILHSFHQDDIRTKKLNEGIRNTFDQEDINIRYWIEYLDSKRFPYQSHRDTLEKTFRYKYKNKRLTAIITTDNVALDFALKNRDEIFISTPIIFTGIRNFDLAKLKPHEDITGILESDHISDTLNLALRLHPDAKKAYLLAPGARNWSLANKLREEFRNKVHVVYINKYFMSDIEQKIKKIEPDSIILTLNEPRTKAGVSVPYDIFNDRLVTITDVPVYGIWDTALGSGIVGGKLVSGFALGATASNMVLSVLKGKNTNDIPIVKESPNEYMFDYHQLTRFNIDEALLPGSSIVINKPFSIYDTYRLQINIALMLVILQAGIIFLLFVFNRKRKLAEYRLKDANDNLERRVVERSEKITETNTQLIKEIEERKQTEKSLRISEEKYSKALLSSADAITITSLSDGRLVEVNETFVKLSGYSREEAVGKTSNELNLWIIPEERDRFFKQLNETGVINNFETDYRNRSGKTFTMSLSGEIFEFMNEPHLITISRDVSEQRKTTLELKRYEQIISSTKDLMSFIDTQYTYKAVNQSYLDAFQKKQDEIIGLTIAELHGKDQFEKIIKPNFDRCLTGETVKLQHWIELANNGTCFVDVVYTPYFEENIITGVVISARDITQQRKTTLELKRYEQIVSSTSDLMAFIDKDFIFQAINKCYLNALGMQYDDVIGKHIKTIIGPDNYYNEIKFHLQRCINGEAIHIEKKVEFPTQGLRHLDIRYNPFHEDENTVSGIVISARDITSAQELSELLHYQATHDELTDLINRREFEKRVQRLLNSDELAQHQHVLCYMDLDQFKVVNDTCGHAAGDELLNQIGKLLRKQIRQRDTLARIGGDEFAILFEHCTLVRAVDIMSKLQNAVNEFRFAWEDKSFSIGISIGLVVIDDHLLTVDEILKQADTACYMAKKDGRNCIRVYEYGDAKLAEIHGVMQWVHPVHEALENDAFKLYKQSIVPLNKGEDKAINHQEILIRMEKDGELILPGLFLPTVEQYGLSSKLDRWVIDKIFYLLNHKIEQDNFSKYFINLSGLSLSSIELLQYIQGELDNNKQLAERVCFEITETAAIANISHASKFINVLRERGCEFALDDFGTGFSSFAYLKNLNVDYIKIDGMFVKDMIQDPLAYSMVKSINEIGHISGIKTIAEFVENEHILKELTDIGIDYVQGYGIGIPQPIEIEDSKPIETSVSKENTNVISFDKKRKIQ